MPIDPALVGLAGSAMIETLFWLADTGHLETVSLTLYGVGTYLNREM